MAVVDGTSIPMPLQGHQDTAYIGHRNRAAATVAQEQGVGIAKFLEDNSALFACSMLVFDDASMWVKRPTDPSPVELNDRIAAKLGARGMNVHLPVLNCQEVWFPKPSYSPPANAESQKYISDTEN